MTNNQKIGPATDLEAKARRIAEIIDRNLYRQDEKVEDARALAIELADAIRAEQARQGDLVAALRDAATNGLIYWEPSTDRGHVAKGEMLRRIIALLAKAEADHCCTTCNGKGMVGGLVRFGDGEVDSVCDPCPNCSTQPISMADKDALIAYLEESNATILAEQGRIAALLEQARGELAIGIAFIGRDRGTDRIDKTLDGLVERFVSMDARIRPLPTRSGHAPVDKQNSGDKTP